MGLTEHSADDVHAWVTTLMFVACTFMTAVFSYVARRLTLEQDIAIEIRGTVREASRSVWRSTGVLAARVRDSLATGQHEQESPDCILPEKQERHDPTTTTVACGY
jgi:hypothetical protein